MFRGTARRAQASVGWAEGLSLVQTLHRIRTQGEPQMRRQAEAALQQVLAAESYADAAGLAREVLRDMAYGPEPRAALIAARCWALRDQTGSAAPLQVRG